MNNFNFTSAAKLNLGLQIKKQLGNGYHQVETVLAKIPFFDQLELTWQENQTANQIICNQKNVPLDETNLLLKTINLLQKDYSFPQSTIRLEKNIPLGSGLGGGSFNAGVLLTQLSQQLALGLTAQQIRAYALKLGADVPFAAQERQIVYEKNHGLENLIQTSLPDLPSCQIVIATQNFSLNTQEMYHQFDQENFASGDLQPLLAGIKKQNLLQIATNLTNDFFPLVSHKFPHLLKLKQELLNLGALGVNLTGKGPTLYAFFPQLENQEKIDLSPLDKQLYHQSFQFFLK
jgi:4-diphosphocytidyl-2-C-methyl-D-erythritol kinase